MRSSDPALELHHKNLLFDFYEAMLTEHQRACFTAYHVHDYSLAEIGAEMNITPQAVFDMLNRTVKKLERYEEKLGLVQRYLIQQDTAEYLRSLIANVDEPLRKNMLTQLDVLLKM